MTDYLTDTEDTIVNHLRDNVSDPLGRGKFWIYSGTMQPKAKTPRIHVRRAAGGDIKYYISAGQKQLYTIPYGVLIQVRLGQLGMISGTRYKGTELLNRITDTIVNTLISNATSLTNIVMVKVNAPGGYAFDDENQLYFNSIPIEAWVQT